MRKRAFSLVELLVVIGIVAVLIAVLLPVLTRAREHARQTQCASNVRQLTAAFLMYANDNRENFPGPSIVCNTAQDWIYWQPGRSLDDGKLVRYLGRIFNDQVLRCPSDDLQRVVHNTEFFGRPYLYSYSANQFIVGPWDPIVKVGQIRHSESIILIAEESETTVDDGCWFPAPNLQHPLNRFATRHARPKPGVDGVGNAGFVDGHVEAATLAFAHDPRHHVPIYGQVPGNRVVLENGPPLPPRPPGPVNPNPRPPSPNPINQLPPGSG